MTAVGREDAGLFQPRAFGDYQLLAPLAKGGMGAIHLAKRVGFRPDIQLFCVVKTLRPTRIDARAMLRRFEDEARIVVTLNHRAICHVFDVGIVDGEHYLAMELIEGVSVRALFAELVRSGRRLEPALALTILDEVLDALEYAHTHEDPQTGAPLHIVHRDVSPQNIMLSFQGAVKLIDFGIVSSSLKLEHTEGGMVVGKIAYMAPEQARAEPIDARTDVFSAGVVLYELVTGHRYYGDLSKGAIQLLLTEGTYAPPLDEVPTALREPLARALLPEPSERTPSAARFQAELAACGIARASGRDLRALLKQLMPNAMHELQALQRGANDLDQASDVESSAPRATSVDGATQVTRIAYAPDVLRSLSEGSSVSVDDDGAARDTTTLLAQTNAPRSPAPPPRRRAPMLLLPVLVALAGGFTLWSAMRPPMTDVRTVLVDDQPPDVHVAIDAVRVVATPSEGGPSVRIDAPPSHDGSLVDEPEAERHEALDPRSLDDDDRLRMRAEDTKPKRRAPRPTKTKTPPKQALPDLAAHFTFLETWCKERSPVCTRDVIARRAQVASLDVAGLRALFKDAERCVVACRR
jgi:serine/threonine protein kinase